MDRRTFIRGGVAAVLLAGPFQGFFARAAHTPVHTDARRLGYGPLAPVRDLRDGVARLHLPPGFGYRSFNPAGASLSDGTVVPGRHDGMGAFRAGGGRTVLVRNHEVNGPIGAFGDPASAYDPRAGGGTTSVEVDRHGNVLRSWVSLNGTQMNCSGGATPWGTWLTCEETVNGPDVGNDHTGQPNSELQQKHGYIFEVPVEGAAEARPIRSAGRFPHEAAVYEAGSNAVYLTEDNFGFPSGFYRYLPPTRPPERKRLDDGGRLQMLAVKGWPRADLAGVHGDAPAVGASFEVAWVDIPDPDPRLDGAANNDAVVAVSSQGLSQGAARFSRLEGAAVEGATVYFTSTQGGSTPAGETPPDGYGRGRGQIWAYHVPTATLTLLYESPSRDVLDFPDNITTSRTGTLVLCEDGDEGNFLRGLTSDGRLFDFAKNNIPDRTDDEFAGVTFDPDFQTLYVNLQSEEGLTMAIWGPWGGGGF